MATDDRHFPITHQPPEKSNDFVLSGKGGTPVIIIANPNPNPNPNPMECTSYRDKNNRWSLVIVRTFGPNGHSSVDMLRQHLLHDVYRWPS